MNWYRIAQVELDFENQHLDYHHGQSVFRLLAGNKETRELVGGIDYNEFEDGIYIDYILVKPEYRRQGIGTQMINKLRELYPGFKINWGWVTDEGASRFKDSLEEQHELV